MTVDSALFPDSASATGSPGWGIQGAATALQAISNLDTNSLIHTFTLTGWALSGGALHTGIPSGSVIVLEAVQIQIEAETAPGSLIGTIQGASSPMSYITSITFRDAATAQSQGQVITSGQRQLNWALAPDGSDSTVFAVYSVQSVLRYSPPPNAPSLTAPLGLFDGMSPTFTVSPSNPSGGDSITETQYEVRRVSTGASMWSSGWLFGTSSPYGGSAMTAGVEYEWRARNRNTFGAVGPWSSFASFTPAPNQAPTTTPIGPTGDIGTTTPTIQFSYSDPDGDPFAHYQVQVRRQSDQAGMWDTGQVATTTQQRNQQQVNLTYAGTALDNTVQYQWRARTWDDRGAQSAYTAWQTFRPVVTPMAPSLSSPAGLQTTLTPDVQGSYNQGSGSTEQAFQYEVRQGQTVIYDSGAVAGNIATGETIGASLQWGTNYAIRARSQDALDTWSEYSSWQDFRTHGVAQTPTGLSPAGSITPNTTPTLSWQHNDPDSHAQTAVQIQLEEVAGSPVSGYDPRTLEQAGTSHQVTETLTISPATTYRWRVRTRGLAAAGYGPWSDWRTFVVSTSTTVTITSPAPSTVLDGPALTAEWSFSGGTGTQQDFRVRIYAADQSTIVYDSGLQGGDAGEWDVSAGPLQNGNTYYLQVTARDTNDLEGQSSLLEFSTAWALPATITGLVVTAVGDQANGAGDGKTMAVLPYAYVNWDASGEPLDVFLRYQVYRREAGGPWLHLANINDRGRNFLQDWSVRSSQPYEYTVTQVIDTGGEDVESEAPPAQGTSLMIRSMMLHSTLDPSIYVELQGLLDDTSRPSVGYVQVFRRRHPTAHVSPNREDGYTVTVTESWSARRDIWDAIEALLDEQERGAHLLLRQDRVHAYVTMDGRSRHHGPVLYTPTLHFRAVHHDEGVP